MVSETEQIYIVISQTGTIFSRLLKIITGEEYNHVSIGLSKDLHCMYSFGRLNPYYPFWGGFVIESPNWGTFKRFFNTKVIVLALNVGEDKFKAISERIEDMSLNRKKYHYNYMGIFFAKFNKTVKRNNYYYCSEFIRDILVQTDIDGAQNIPEIAHPMNFLKIPSTSIVYKGKLKDYSA